MGSIKAKQIIDRVSHQLNDNDGDRFSPTELLNFLNSAQRAIVLAKPDAYTVVNSIQLVSGCIQTIDGSAGEFKFLRAIRNMGTDGTTPGTAITHIDQDELDRVEPNWSNAIPSATVVHVVTHSVAPKIFYTYPPQPTTTGYIEAIRSVAPPKVASKDNVIQLDDIYEDPIYAYMMCEANSKDTTAARQEKAAKYFAMFERLLGLKHDADRATEAAKK